MKKTIEREVATIRRQLDDLTAQLASLTEESVDELQGMVGDYATEAGRTVSEKWDETKEKVKKAGENSRQYVEDHPWQSIGLGLAAGFLAGMMLGRKR